MMAGWLTEFVEGKPRASGGRPRNFGNDTLTQGTLHAPRLGDLDAGKFQCIFIGRDTLNTSIDGARNIPSTVGSKADKHPAKQKI